MRKEIFVLGLIVLLGGEAMGTVLPALKAPRYLVLSGLNKCLLIEKQDGRDTLCWPLNKPKDCPDFTWNKLDEFSKTPADGAPACADRLADQAAKAPQENQ